MADPQETLAQEALAQEALFWDESIEDRLRRARRAYEQGPAAYGEFLADEYRNWRAEHGIRDGERSF